MNFFNTKTTWSNGQLLVLQTCTATAFLMVGSYFDDLFDGYFYPMIGVFAVTFVWSARHWLKGMGMGRGK